MHLTLYNQLVFNRSTGKPLKTSKISWTHKLKVQVSLQSLNYKRGQLARLDQGRAFGKGRRNLQVILRLHRPGLFNFQSSCSSFLDPFSKFHYSCDIIFRGL